MSSLRLLDLGPIALLLCSQARCSEVDRCCACPTDHGGHRSNVERVLESGNEAVQVSAAKTAADLQACEGRVYQHEVLAVIPVELGYRLGEGIFEEPDPAIGPCCSALQGGG